MPVQPIKCVVVGYGYWGPNLVRNIIENTKYELVGIVESDLERRSEASARFNVPVFETLDFMELNDVKLAVIATRPRSHLSLVEYFTLRKIICLIPKPVGDSSSANKAMLQISEKFQNPIFAEYTYLHSDALRKIRSWFVEGSKPQSYVSYRCSLGIIQSDVNVIQDLASHDLANLIWLKRELPVSVQAVNLGSKINLKSTSCFLSLKWGDGFFAAVHVNWLAPSKHREITIMKENEAIIFDEMRKESPLTLIAYDETFKISDSENPKVIETRNISFKMGQEKIVPLNGIESLKLEFENLAVHINSGFKSEFPCDHELSSGVWKIMDSLQLSLENEGTIVNV